MFFLSAVCCCFLGCTFWSGLTGWECPQFEHTKAILLLFHLDVYTQWFPSWIIISKICFPSFGQASVVIWEGFLIVNTELVTMEGIKGHIGGKPRFFLSLLLLSFYEEFLCLGSYIHEKCAFTLNVTLLFVQYCIHSFSLRFQAYLSGWLLS